MKSFHKFVEDFKLLDEAEYNKEWWDSKSPTFQSKYIKRHPNSIYAKKLTFSPEFDVEDEKLKDLGYQFKKDTSIYSKDHPSIKVFNKNNEESGGIQLSKTSDGYYGVTNINIYDDTNISLGRNLVKMAEKEYGKLKAKPSPGSEEFWTKVNYEPHSDGFWYKKTN